MFHPQREYNRALLGPVRISDRTPTVRETPQVLKPTTLPGWKSTTHRFIGTEDRVEPLAWPASKFQQNPEAIPDDPANNVHYDPQTAVPKPTGGKSGIWQAYSDSRQSRPSSVPPPWIVAKRFVSERTSQQESASPITLLVVPGVGAPKEMFEPMLEGILTQQRSAGFTVGEIWSLDMPWGGEAAQLNPIGFLYGNEKDIARDLFLFVTAYLPLQAGHDLPLELVPRTPRGNNPQAVRANLHLLGHSLGAQAAMLVAAHAPDLFASLTVIDPAMIPAGKIQKAFTAMPKDVLCAGVEWKHESPEALYTALKSNRRTKAWNDRIRKIFVTRATEPDGNGGVRLIAHPRLEWAIYYDQETPMQCYDRLIDIQTPLNAIMPSRPFAVPPKMLEADLAKLKQKKQLTWVPKATHQIPYEKVDECVGAVVSWLSQFGADSKARL